MSAADREFIQEIGVKPVVEAAQPDLKNPLGDRWGRRNYEESGYLSGCPELDPDTYGMPGFDLYRQYFDRTVPGAKKH